jgi:hypothetical protein
LRAAVWQGRQLIHVAGSKTQGHRRVALFCAPQFKVKMVTADDEKTTDITVEGDKEEIERFWKVRSKGCQAF